MAQARFKYFEDARAVADRLEIKYPNRQYFAILPKASGPRKNPWREYRIDWNDRTNPRLWGTVTQKESKEA